MDESKNNIKNFIKELITKIKTRQNIVWFALLAILITVLLWFFGLRQLLTSIELMTYDWRAQIATDKGPFNSKFAHADKDIVILTADNYTYDQLIKYPEIGIGRWPWQRKTWGEIVEYITVGKPKAIVFDIKFEGKEGTSKNSIASDQFFAEKLKQSSNTILGIALSTARKNLEDKIPHIKSKYNLDDDTLDQFVAKTQHSTNAIHKKSLLNVDESEFFKLPEKKREVLLNNITFYRKSAVPKIFLDSIDSTGIINISADTESKVRYNVPLYKIVTTKNKSYTPSLPLATVLSLSDKSQKNIKLDGHFITFENRKIPINNKGKVLLNWHGNSGQYSYYHVSDVLLSYAIKKGILKAPKDFEILDPNIFKNKIIILGQTKAGTDILATTMDISYPGPEIIATAIDNYLNDADITNNKRRKFITTASPIWTALLTLLLCSLIVTTNIRTKSYINSFIIYIFILLAFIIFSIILFSHPAIRIWLNMTYPLIFMMISAIASYLIKINLEQTSKKNVENMFGKFVSPQVLGKLLQNPNSAFSGNQRKHMTVLFSDIRGFTTLSEKIDANILIPQLNEYFNEFVEIILKNEGTMDKFIGDAVMAFWGDPLPVENHAYKSVKTAIEILNKLEKLNQKWETEGKAPINIGFGINTGDMIVGYMGSDKIVDYTVIGDNVNLASRLESLCKQYDTRIIISEATYNECKENIEAQYLDEVVVKGKHNAVKIYKVTGYK